MYTVIGTVNSRAFRVMWMLEELGEPYKLISAGPRSPQALEYNPLGKIPVLLDGNAVLTDSVAIMTYLADKHGRLIAPAGTPERAQQDALTLWIIDEMDAALWSYAKHSFILPEHQRVPEVRESLKAGFLKAADQLAERLDRPCLFGVEITPTDILAAHCIDWSIGAKFPRLNNAVAYWAKSMRERSAYKAARAKQAG